jgi:hypothetical protein
MVAQGSTVAAGGASQLMAPAGASMSGNSPRNLSAAAAPGGDSKLQDVSTIFIVRADGSACSALRVVGCRVAKLTRNIITQRHLHFLTRQLLLHLFSFTTDHQRARAARQAPHYAGAEARLHGPRDAQARPHCLRHWHR